MKPSLLLPLALLSFSSLAASAAFVESFDLAVSNGGSANFAPQLGWTINDPSVDQSFIQPISAYGAAGKSVGLGGFYSEPASLSTRLSHVINETLAGSVFSADFTLINRYAGDPGFLNQDDRFGFVLGGGSGDILNITVNPTSDENIRSLSVNGTPVPDNGFFASDYNTQLWYNLGVTFTANGANLDYTLSLLGSPLSYSGSLAGQAGALATTVGLTFDVLGASTASAGSNYLAVDNISFAPVPEPSASIVALLSLVGLTFRRRR